MARIRTIKPEFFTSDDIVELEPIERLFYIALWCEADREGRMVWSPRTIKRRYFPEDSFDVSRVTDALMTRGLLVLYGGENDDTFCVIPTFAAHQNINPRESASSIPEPPQNRFKNPTRQPRVNHASARDSDAQRGKSRKGKEIVGRERGVGENPKPKDSFSQNGSALSRTEQIKRYAQIKGIPVEDVPEDLFPQVVTL